MPTKDEIRKEYLDQAVKLFEDGARFDEVKNILKEKGAGFYDIDFVMNRSKKQLISTFYEAFEALLLEGMTPEEICTKLNKTKIHPDVFLEMVNTRKTQMIEDAAQKMFVMIKNNINQNHAINTSINAVFTETIARERLKDMLESLRDPAMEAWDQYRKISGYISIIIGVLVIYFNIWAGLFFIITGVMTLYIDTKTFMQLEFLERFGRLFKNN